MRKCLKMIMLLFLGGQLLSCMPKKPMAEKRATATTHDQLIGVKKIDKVLYRTVFTENNLDSCCAYYLKKLKMESSRENSIVLFYNQIDSTPTSLQLNNLDSIDNGSLIGGIEKDEGLFYQLMYSNKQLKRMKQL